MTKLTGGEGDCYISSSIGSIRLNSVKYLLDIFKLYKIKMQYFII